MQKGKVMKRRDFLKTTAVGAAAGLSLPAGVEKVFSSPASAPTGPGPGNKWPGRVAINFNKAAVSGTKADTTVIKKMVDDAIIKLAEKDTVGAAWKEIFPATLTATSKIAIKVNTLNSGLPAPHWSSVLAITNGLQLMDFSGTKFPAANISIYEMGGSLSSAGFTAANFPNISIVTDTAVDGGDGALNNRTYAKTLKDADFLINVFSPRGHSFPPAGSKFTLGFKSHYGTYSNPGGIHSNYDNNFQQIVCTGVVYKKLVLSMCSGIYGMNEGNGPVGSADKYGTYAQTIDKTSTTDCPTTIILSTDPVSVEMQSIKMIRLNKGGKYGTADMPPYLQASGGITGTTLTSTLNVGTIDEAKMDIRRIINGTSTPVINTGKAVSPDPQTKITAHQIAGHGSVFLEFALPQTHIGNDAFIDVVNVQGVSVRRLSTKVLGAVNHVSWDEKDVSGAAVPMGRYLVKLTSGSTSLSANFSIVR
jgi:hypothetical protein